MNKIKEEYANGYVEGSCKGRGMDMNHSKMEGMKRTTSIRSKWICPKICKGRNGNGSF
jgi:hypothetical protein